MPDNSPDLTLRIGHDELVIRQRYQVLIRPGIRLTRHGHLQKIRDPRTPTADSSFDF